MMKKIGVTAMCAVVSSLSGCYEAPPTNWSTVVMNGYYYTRCPSTVACVMATRGGVASVASYNGITTVTSSAGNNTGAAVATNGTTSIVAASAGSAYAVATTVGSNVVVNSSAGSQSTASLVVDSSGSHGSTSAGTTGISWP